MVQEGHDIGLFSSAEKLTLKLEAPDVEAGSYAVFDSRGRRIQLGVTQGSPNSVAIAAIEPLPTHADELRSALIDGLSAAFDGPERGSAHMRLTETANTRSASSGWTTSGFPEDRVLKRRAPAVTRPESMGGLLAQRRRLTAQPGRPSIPTRVSNVPMLPPARTARVSRQQKTLRLRDFMRPGRFELPRSKRTTRPSTLRVYQFRHRRVGG